MFHPDLLSQYSAGPAILRAAVNGMRPEELLARPIPGKWSTLEVVCHLSDCEPLYAERIKQVIVEDHPTLMSRDPDPYVNRLAYQQRDLEEELAFVEAQRKQMARILSCLDENDFQRVGIHSADGPLTLEVLLRRITRHIPHHVAFIEEKRSALVAR